MKRTTNRRVVKVRITLKHIHGDLLDLYESVMQVLENQCQQARTLEKIMASNAELNAKLDTIGTGLDEIGTQLEKGLAEIEKEIADLKAAGQTTPEIDAKLDSISAKVVALKGGVVQKLDDLNPDAA